MEDAPLVLVEEDDGIMIVTLNRPEKYNALSVAMVHTISDAVDRLRDTPALKVMLIRARGKHFSAGADLKEGSHQRRQPADPSGRCGLGALSDHGQQGSRCKPRVDDRAGA